MKVVKIVNIGIEFDNGTKIMDYHDNDCCENVYADWKTFIQWKGTDVCMDWYCECGEHNHEDRYFCYEVICQACGKEYTVGTEVSLTLKQTT